MQDREARKYAVEREDNVLIQGEISLEQVCLRSINAGSEIMGTFLGAEKVLLLHVTYKILCDSLWQTRFVHVEQTWNGLRRSLFLHHDGRGEWHRNADAHQTLAGCTDVDIGISPATNAIAINRLRLEVGSMREIRAAWVRFPQSEVISARQSYERLAENRYQYLNLASGFFAVLSVEDDRIPIDYRATWRRIARGRERQNRVLDKVTSTATIWPIGAVRHWCCLSSAGLACESHHLPLVGRNRPNPAFGQ